MALSTAEAEHYSASLGAAEVTVIYYVLQLLRDMGIEPKSPTPVYEDNTACIEWTNNVFGGRERAKHIDIWKHFSHEAAQLGHLRLYRVPTADQLFQCVYQKPPAEAACCVCCSAPKATMAGLVRDVGPHEGKRDSQRKQSRVNVDSYEGCFAVAGILGSSVVVTCLR